MKKIHISFLIFFFSSFFLKSQDSIILKNAEIIVGKVNSINDKEIEYKNFNNLSGPNYLLNLSKVAGIKYSNGFLEVYDEKSLTLNFRDYFVKQNTTNSNNQPGDFQDSILLSEHLSLESKYNQLLQINNALINNQIILDSLLKINYELQKLSFQKIHDTLSLQQQNTDNSTQLIMDSLSDFKNQVTAEKSKSKEPAIVPKTIGIGISFFEHVGFLVPVSFGKYFRAEFDLTLEGDGISAVNLSLFPMYQKGRTNIYMGLVVPLYTPDYYYWLGSTFGAEYLFAENFSFGGDVTIRYIFSKDFNTTSRILLRFYF